MDRGGIGSHDRKERAYYLELHVLVPVLRRLADLVHNGVDEPPGKSSVALWLLIVRVEAIIWVVTVQQPMRHKLLNMVEDLLGKTRYLGIQRQLHEAEVFVRAENLIISVGLDLLDRIKRLGIELGHVERRLGHIGGDDFHAGASLGQRDGNAPAAGAKIEDDW